MSDHHEKFDNPFHDPAAGNLADALARFEARTDETPSRKARVRAAVSAISRLLNKAPEQISAQPRFLLRCFIGLKRRPTALSAKSLANYKTELRYLVRTVCAKGNRSAFRPLSPEWVAFRGAITEEPQIWKLSRFMAFCSASGIAPSDVDDAVIERFRTAVNGSDEVAKPEQQVRLTIHTWNEIADRRADMAGRPLLVPARRVSRWTIDPASFPRSFRQDVDTWLERLSRVDPEADDGPIRPLRPASLLTRRHLVFKAASALVFSGRPIETVTSLVSLVQLDAFKAIMRHLRERQGGEPTTALHGLATALRYVAKHHVKVADRDLQRIARICANYEVGDRGLRSRNRARLMNFEDERVLAALLHLPQRLLEEAAHPRTSPRKARLLAQVAVAIEVELHTPVRLANLAALNLQRNIQPVVVKGERRWIVRFDRHETKNRSLLTHELPEASVRLIERAMRFYAGADGWLFPGRKGSHKTPNMLGVQVKQVVEARLNRPFNTHLFRGLAAVTQLRENVNGFELARALLGDRSDKVIRAHYTSTAEQHLIRQAQETIQRVRIRTAPIAPARR